jgi:hypothetical protein
MRAQLSAVLAAAAVLATALVLAFPSKASAWTYSGPDVKCNGACPAPDQHCQPVNVSSYPIICQGNGRCPINGNLCFAGTPCAYYATWDCQCWIEGVGYGDVCSMQ